MQKIGLQQIAFALDPFSPPPPPPPSPAPEAQKTSQKRPVDQSTNQKGVLVALEHRTASYEEGWGGRTISLSSLVHRVSIPPSPHLAISHSAMKGHVFYEFAFVAILTAMACRASVSVRTAPSGSSVAATDEPGEGDSMEMIEIVAGGAERAAENDAVSSVDIVVVPWVPGCFGDAELALSDPAAACASPHANAALAGAKREGTTVDGARIRAVQAACSCKSISDAFYALSPKATAAPAADAPETAGAPAHSSPPAVRMLAKIGSNAIRQCCIDEIERRRSDPSAKNVAAGLHARVGQIVERSAAAAAAATTTTSPLPNFASIDGWWPSAVVLACERNRTVAGPAPDGAATARETYAAASAASMVACPSSAGADAGSAVRRLRGLDAIVAHGNLDAATGTVTVKMVVWDRAPGASGKDAPLRGNAADVGAIDAAEISCGALPVQQQRKADAGPERRCELVRAGSPVAREFEDSPLGPDGKPVRSPADTARQYRMQVWKFGISRDAPAAKITFYPPGDRAWPLTAILRFSGKGPTPPFPAAVPAPAIPLPVAVPVRVPVPEQHVPEPARSQESHAETTAPAAAEDARAPDGSEAIGGADPARETAPASAVDNPKAEIGTGRHLGHRPLAEPKRLVPLPKKTDGGVFAGCGRGCRGPHP